MKRRSFIKTVAALLTTPTLCKANGVVNYETEQLKIIKNLEPRIKLGGLFLNDELIASFRNFSIDIHKTSINDSGNSSGIPSWGGYGGIEVCTNMDLLNIDNKYNIKVYQGGEVEFYGNVKLVRLEFSNVNSLNMLDVQFVGIGEYVMIHRK